MRLGQWYMELVNRINARQPANILEIDEKFIELAQHVVKKNWLTLESVARNADFSKYVDCFLQSVCCISMKVCPFIWSATFYQTIISLIGSSAPQTS